MDELGELLSTIFYPLPSTEAETAAAVVAVGQLLPRFETSWLGSKQSKRKLPLKI